MKSYAKLYAALFAIALSCAVAAPTFAENTAVGGAVGSGVSTTATIESIDYNTRHVTLKLASDPGAPVTIKVPEFAHNFSQLKKGDTISINYTEALAIDVKKSDGTAPTSHVGASIERAPLGAKPEGKVTSTITIAATVESIDYDKRRLTLKGPEGNLVTLTVGPEATHFNEVKKGETVVTTYTEALAMKLEKSAG